MFLAADDGATPATSANSSARKRSLDEDGALQDAAEEEPVSKKLRRSFANAEDGNKIEKSTESLENRGIPLQERGDANNQPLSGKLQGGKPRPSDRTARYVFSSTQEPDAEDEDVNEEILRERTRLHQKFVKKLGRPDSMAELRRKNHVLDDAVPADEDGVDEDGEEEEPEPKATQRGKKIAASKKGANKLTPMEKQMLEIKRNNLDTVLLIEVGYKYRFFGEDARTAAKELSIVCIPGKFRYDERMLRHWAIISNY